MADLPVLDATDQRILGSLLEKQRTVPATYPLSLNALRSACNQISSRDPSSTTTRRRSRTPWWDCDTASWSAWCGRSPGAAR